jgi:hypothetical protein
MLLLGEQQLADRIGPKSSTKEQPRDNLSLAWYLDAWPYQDP